MASTILVLLSKDSKCVTKTEVSWLKENKQPSARKKGYGSDLKKELDPTLQKKSETDLTSMIYSQQLFSLNI